MSSGAKRNSDDGQATQNADLSSLFVARQPATTGTDEQESKRAKHANKR